MPIKITSSKMLAVVLAFSSLIFAERGYTDEHDMESTAKTNKHFTQCAAIRMKEINLKHLKENPSKYTTQVPEGWTVVSGSGGQGHPKLLICR